MIIGTAAYCGSGQDTLADSICRIYNIVKFSMGDMIRNLADEQGRSKDRTTLRFIRKECDRLYGRMYFPKMMVDKIIASGNQNLVVTGLRTMEEYELFNRTFDFRLIFLDAKEHIRLNRMLKRGEEKDEETISKLKKQMIEENELFDYKKLAEVADIYFDFSMDISVYRRNELVIVAQILEKLGASL